LELNRSGLNIKCKTQHKEIIIKEHYAHFFVRTLFNIKLYKLPNPFTLKPEPTNKPALRIAAESLTLVVNCMPAGRRPKCLTKKTPTKK